MAAPVLSNLMAHTSSLSTHSSWSCTQIEPPTHSKLKEASETADGNKKPSQRNQEIQRERRRTAAPQLQEENITGIKWLELENLGVNHTSNLSKDGINDKKHESSSSGTEWTAAVTLGLALHSTCNAWLRSCTLSPFPLRFTQDKGARMGHLVMQYLQLRNGTWNTPCTEHNTTKPNLLAPMEVAALNSRHQITAEPFLLWALHQLLSTHSVSLEEVKDHKKRQENAK